MEFNCKKLKRENGNINIMFSYMALSIVALLVAYGIANNKIIIMNNKLEDALVSSNLASATVDLKEYAEKGLIVNIESQSVIDSYNAFLSTLKKNLSLNDNLSLKKDSIISSNIKIEKFVIYSDVKSHIEINEVLNGSVSTSQREKGIMTPNGKNIEDTTIYAKLGFQVSVMGQDFYVSKDNVVRVTEKDIVIEN